jgi:DNA polymerase-3 subunit gamma/tau
VRGDIPAALVEYNAILQQGFDGHLFVSGLAHHFRDLLVSQDPSTLPLLEVSEELTVRYGEQAQQVDRELLVKGLDRLAQCDSQYKSSKEPRLLVELMLIQLCRINAVPNAAVEASAQKKSPDLTAAPAASTVVAEPSSSPPPRSRSATVSESDPKPVQAKYVPKRKLANQVSIKDTVTAAIAEAPPTRELEADMGTGMPASSKKVNAALLLQVWRDYALRLKKNGRDSLHATLMANEPTILGPSQIGFTIVNTVQENYMREEKPELLGNLRRQLDDPGLDLVVTKLEAVVKPRYTNLDKFKLMAEKNPALLNLREALDLDLG